MAKRIAIGSDHGGYRLKEKIKEMLEGKGCRVKDVGPDSDDACDYPKYGYDAAKLVSTGKADRGIVICKTGIGMSVVANKLRGVRAGLCFSVADAESARWHNDTNVLVLAAKKVSARKAGEIAEVWLKTPALKGRHAKRVKQISAIETREFGKR